jgi:hypothetical protein
LDVVRGARICSAAHGGQVLVSETTRSVVRGDEPAGIELRDLGEHHLKDLAHAERLFQLIAPVLLADFPPPRTLDNRSQAAAPVPALHVAERQRELAAGALSAVRDLGALGPSIARAVEEDLRAAGIATPATARSPAGLGAAKGFVWLIVGIALVTAAVWLLLRVV